jgi:cytochrome b6-f complex iron-sulfur subunit
MSVIGALILAIGAFIRGIYLFLFPGSKEKSYHKYLVCKTGDIKIGEAKEITLGKTPVFVVRLENQYKVYSGVCTHLGCIIQWEQDKQHFYCPCHKGYFDKTGKVTGGPPPRPLDEYTVEVEKNLVFIQVEDKTRGPWA